MHETKGKDKSQLISEQEMKMSKIINDFDKCIKRQTFVLSKVPVQAIDFINNALKKFAKINNILLQNEIGKYNRERAFELEHELKKVSERQQ